MSSASLKGGKPESVDRLSPDRPVERAADDRLDYSAFAKKLAQAIRERAPTEGLVLAIHGPWGTGKSTVLSLVEAFLKEGSDGDSPTVIHFNPWWFSGRDDLLRRFFDQLIAKFASGGTKFKKIREKVAALAGLVGDSPIPYADWVKAVGEAVAPSERSIHDLRKSVEGLLSSLESPVVIIIDDIDRLSLPEIRDLFRLVKAVANFPNVIYLLAFDRSIVGAALAGEFGESGEEYLEKIVQVPFELPAPDKAAIWRILFEKLDRAIKDTPADYFNMQHWNNVFGDLIAPFVETPRDAVRLANAVSVTYPMVHDEVNAVDFIALETLRLFCPSAYSVIRENPPRFAGPSGERSGQKEEDHAFHEDWLSRVPEPKRSVLRDGLQRLFPRLEWVWGNTVWGHDWESDWKRAGRISSPSVFPTFFALQLGEGLFSKGRLRAALASATKPEDLSALLSELSAKRRPDGVTHLHHFLTAVHEFADDIPDSHARIVLQALSAQGDAVIAQERDERGLFEFPIWWTMRAIVYLLTKVIPADQRLLFLESLIQGGNALCFTATSFGLLWDNKHDERLLDDQAAAKLKTAILTKLRAEAGTGRLEKVASLGLVLQQWEELGGQGEVTTWLGQQLVRDEFFVTLCRGYTAMSKGQVIGQRGEVKRRQIDAPALFQRVESDAAGARADALLSLGGLSDEDLEILTLVASAAKQVKTNAEKARTVEQ